MPPHSFLRKIIKIKFFSVTSNTLIITNGNTTQRTHVQSYIHTSYSQGDARVINHFHEFQFYL